MVIYDSGIDTDKYTSFVATDNDVGGAMGADRLGKILGGRGKMVMIKTTPGGASTTAREDGFPARAENRNSRRFRFWMSVSAWRALRNHLP